MADGKVSKNQSQRKRSGDCCINNLKIKLNPSSAHNEFNRSNHPSKKLPPTNSQNPHFIRGSSLDNISNLQWEHQQIANNKFNGHNDVVDIQQRQDYSTLRRTRSLAISSRENPFYSLNCCEYKEEKRQEEKNPRKVQLIPRAKISNKSFIKDLREDSWWFEDFTSSRKTFLKSTDYNRSTFNQQLPRKSLDSDQFQREKFDSNHFEDNSRKSNRNLRPTSISLSDDQFLSRVTDNLPINSFNGKQFPLKNTNTSWGGSRDSISYDENIVLRHPPQSVKENLHRSTKLRTLRGPIPYENFDYSKLPQFDTDHDKKLFVREELKPPPPPQQQLKSKNINDNGNNDVLIESFNLEFETDTNCDEIKLNNEKIVKEDDAEQSNKLIETEENKEFKTIIEIADGATTDKNNNNNSKKNHNHSYLKEILESQKGSKLPLQSFITKKLSNLTRRSSKCNLTKNNNNFVSLPDINKQDFLQQKAPIQTPINATKQNNKLNENRFIINIGRYFDVTAATSNTPTYPPSSPSPAAAVDFELKIAKVPKKNKKKDTDFKEVVNKVNKTLQKTGFSSIDLINNNNNRRQQTDSKNMDPEVLQKVDSARNYWMKIVNETNNNKRETNGEITRKSDVEKSATKSSQQIKKPSPKPSSSWTNSNYFGSNSTKTNHENSTSTTNSPHKKEEQQETSKAKTGLLKSNSINVSDCNHAAVRYRVIKSDLFHQKLLANHIDFNQFDELIEYVEDQSLKELLNNNNIVIIEPIRSKSDSTTKQSVTNRNDDDDSSSLRKRHHFFYHSMRMNSNKEVNDDELPNPDVVRQARKFFEQAEKEHDVHHHYQNNHDDSHDDDDDDPDKDRCSTDSFINVSDCEDENTFDSIETECCNEYISEDILSKIRQYGTTVTYYGGKVIDQNRSQSVRTDIILDEIRSNEKRCLECRRKSMNKQTANSDYIKYKLIKSNSCNSRLELETVHPDENMMLLAKQSTSNIKMNNEIHNNSIKYSNNNNNNNGGNKSVIKNKSKTASNFHHIEHNKNAINERIKSNNYHHHHHQSKPKIIGEERKEIKPSSSLSSVFNPEIRNYEYHEKILPIKRACDIEFENYEVA